MKYKQGFTILSWSLYDLANQFFALNIISLYFPRWLTIENKSPEIFYGLAFGISMLLVAVCAPVLGIVSDIRGKHKAFLVNFTLLCIVFTMGLGWSPNIFIALLFFAIANFGCQEATVFYNAMMIDVAPKGKIGFVSGLGRMFAYSGAILALYLTKPVILKMGYKPTFFITGVSFLIFSLPCLIFVKNAPRNPQTDRDRSLQNGGLSAVLKRLKKTIFDNDEFGELKYFLRALFFTLCAVNAILLFMAVYATRVFGLEDTQVINLIAVSTIFAILGSVFSGVVSDLIGYRRSLLAIFFLWGVCILAGATVKPPFHWLVGALGGISLGSTWVVSRALIVKLTPKEMMGEAFGLFNLVGYLAGIVGPIFWGLILLYFSTLGERGYRLALSSLIVFVATGFILLLRTTGKNTKPRESF